MAYISIEDFTEYIGSDRVADEDTIQRSLNAAEAAINVYCGRTFDPPADDQETKTYVPGGYGELVTIHDIADTAGLTVADNGTTLSADNYQLEPLQRWIGARPYYQIRRLNGFWYRDYLAPRATISITTARWGWSSIPPAVLEATVVLAKDLVHLRDNRFGVAGFGEFGAVRVRDNPHVKMLLSDLRHPSSIGIG